jgi:hypothetical protein
MTGYSADNLNGSASGACHGNAVMSGLRKVEVSDTFEPPSGWGVVETGMSEQELQRMELIALR